MDITLFTRQRQPLLHAGEDMSEPYIHAQSLAAHLNDKHASPIAPAVECQEGSSLGLCAHQSNAVSTVQRDAAPTCCANQLQLWSDYPDQMIARCPGQKQLVFAYHKNVMDKLQKGLEKQKLAFVRIDGTTSPVERQKAVRKFQETQRTTIALLSIRAANVRRLHPEMIIRLKSVKDQNLSIPAANVRSEDSAELDSTGSRI